jgi:DNA gyrase subunit A
MAEFASEILHVNIEEEMKQSYLDYAMSVIVGRALPDVRDGLKPVHRRVLWAMNDLGNDWNRPYKKSARVVGDVIGKYHPHGDTAVYDAIVRMAQPFSMREMLVDGQGNFGSVDGDSPAAMRYTEVRMSRIAHELIADLDKETVDFVETYDGSEREPTVFPTRIPNLLVNGSSGIAVGMATNIPPHNLGEVIDACLGFVDDSSITIDGLMEHIKGPDFPTAASINGAEGIKEAYHTGRGRIYVRAKAHVEPGDGTERDKLVVTELPYQVNKARLLEKIAELHRAKKIEGIAELRDESDKDGMRMVVEVRRGEVPEVILNLLYQHTQLQNVFGINIVALVDNQPRVLNLRQIVEAFIRHRREVVTRRSLYELRRARNRAHLLEGQAVALANIDPVIALIKASESPPVARVRLTERTWEPGVVSEMLARAGADATRPEELSGEFGLGPTGYRFSEAQAQSILDMRLNRLTSLEQGRIVSEYDELLARIEILLGILSDPSKLMAVIRGELVEIREKYGTDPRRTEIMEMHRGFNREDFINPEDVAVTFSHLGYVKAQSLDQYRAQRRGGRGKAATRNKDEDFVDNLIVANTHDTVLCFSSLGTVYWLKVYDIPQESRTARGKPIVNLLPLASGERITAVLPIAGFDQEGYVFFATARGTVKKSALSAYSRPRTNGIIAIDLDDDDELVGVTLTDGSRNIMLFASSGKAIHFDEQQVRPMGRSSRGVRGMTIGSDERVISLVISDPETKLLTVTENGFGKCTASTEFRMQKRGGMGIIGIQTTARNGALVGALPVSHDDQVMLISDGGTLVRTRVDEISVLGRNTQGVTLIRLDDGERLVGLDRVAEDDTPDDELSDDDLPGDGLAGDGLSGAGTGPNDDVMDGLADPE